MTGKSGGNSLTHKYLPNIQKITNRHTTIDFTYQTPHLQKLERNIICKIFYTWKSFLKPWKSLRMKGWRNHFIHNFFSHTCTTIPGGTNLAQSWLNSWESLHWKNSIFLTTSISRVFSFTFFTKNCLNLGVATFDDFYESSPCCFPRKGLKSSWSSKGWERGSGKSVKHKRTPFSTVGSNFWKPAKNKFTPFDFTNLFKPTFIVFVSGDFEFHTKTCQSAAGRSMLSWSHRHFHERE